MTAAHYLGTSSDRWQHAQRDLAGCTATNMHDAGAGNRASSRCRVFLTNRTDPRGQRAHQPGSALTCWQLLVGYLVFVDRAKQHGCRNSGQMTRNADCKRWWFLPPACPGAVLFNLRVNTPRSPVGEASCRTAQQAGHRTGRPRIGRKPWRRQQSLEPIATLELRESGPPGLSRTSAQLRRRPSRTSDDVQANCSAMIKTTNIKLLCISTRTCRIAAVIEFDGSNFATGEQANC